MNRKKVVCSCRHVTKGDIADAIEGGAVTAKEVRKATGAGKGCGHCKKKIKKCVKKLVG